MRSSTGRWRKSRNRENLCSDRFNRERTVRAATLAARFFGGKRRATHVIASQCSHWRGNPLPPCLALWERCPGRGGEGLFYPLSHFVTAPPEWEPRGRGERIATPVCGLVRNDILLTGLVRNDLRHFKRAYCSYDRRSLLIPQRKTGDFLGVFPIEKGKWVWYTDSRIWKKKVFL